MNTSDDDDFHEVLFPDGEIMREASRSSSAQRPRDARRRLEDLLEDKRLREQLHDYLSEEDEGVTG